jgi:zinc protease
MKRNTLLVLLTTSLFGADLPTAASLMDRYIEVTGGAAAYQSIQSQSVKAEIEFVGQGIKGKTTTINVVPSHSMTTMELAGLGKMLSGVWDGTVWESSAMQGHRLAAGAERNLMLRMNDPQAAANWRKHYSGATTEAEEEIDGQVCYRVVATPKDGGKPEMSWFSKATGLVVKTKMTLISPMGEIPLEIVVSDYRKVGSLLMPHRSMQSVGPQKIDNRVQEIVFNQKIDLASLTPPEEVKALIAKQKP